jgi:hypothetical protein
MKPLVCLSRAIGRRRTQGETMLIGDPRRRRRQGPTGSNGPFVSAATTDLTQYYVMKSMRNIGRIA